MIEHFTFWLAGFCTGVAFTGGLAGWFRRRMGPPKGSYGNCVPMPPGTPPPGYRRVYFDMPSTIAECGGPCSFGGPELCDCGALWRDVPTTPKPEIVPGFHGPRRTVRWFINNPVQIAECGGPCTVGPTHCDCGALWVDVPTTNPPPTDP